MKKLLVALDGSPCSLKAVDHVGRQFSGEPEIRITLFHVLPYPPARFWDWGHLPERTEKQKEEEATSEWLKKEYLKVKPNLDRAVEMLTSAGIRAEAITLKALSDSVEPSKAILEEAKTGGYDSVYMGRCPHEKGEHAIIGGVSEYVEKNRDGLDVKIIE